MKKYNTGIIHLPIIITILVIGLIGVFLISKGVGKVKVKNPQLQDTTQPSVKLSMPNGGEIWKVGETYTVSWTATNAPKDSWVWLTYTVPISSTTLDMDSGDTVECFGQKIPVTQGSFSWKISDSLWHCSDAGFVFKSKTSFQTKVKVQLYTGSPLCTGFPSIDNPCITGTRTLLSEDESDNYFTVTNLP